MTLPESGGTPLVSCQRLRQTEDRRLSAARAPGGGYPQRLPQIRAVLGGVSDGTRANVDAQARRHRPCRATVAVKAQAYTAKATAMVALPASMMIVMNPTLAPPAPYEGRTCSAWAQRREKEYEREIKKPLR